MGCIPTKVARRDSSYRWKGDTAKINNQCEVCSVFLFLGGVNSKMKYSKEMVPGHELTLPIVLAQKQKKY